uniref:Uncharacterized protein n=1 Tax=Oryza nivara TaxID=4536 RepID=A0A0E0ILS6_ORYNI
MGSVGLVSPLPPMRFRPLGARRRLHDHQAGPPTSWHGFAPPSGVAPSRRSRSRSAVVAARAHQLAGPPSFCSLVSGEKWDQERAIWELGFFPSPRSALHPARIGRLRFAQRRAVAAVDYATPNGPQKCIGPSPHMWVALSCSACGPSN